MLHGRHDRKIDEMAEPAVRGNSMRLPRIQQNKWPNSGSG
jgi:hypothetical protein